MKELINGNSRGSQDGKFNQEAINFAEWYGRQVEHTPSGTLQFHVPPEALIAQQHFPIDSSITTSVM